MLFDVHPMLPMRNKSETKEFYVSQLGFKVLGGEAFTEYLMIHLDKVEIHFFLAPELDPLTNDAMCYIRTDNVDEWYEHVHSKNLSIPKLGELRDQPWKQREFSVTDPNGNLIIWGEDIS